MTELHESPQLHAALHVLADGPPPDLANLVVAGAIRRRARTRMITVAATLTTVLAIGLPVTVLQHRAPPGVTPGRPTASLPAPSIGFPANPTGHANPPRPGGGPQVLDAYVIEGAPGASSSWLLDRGTGRYTQLPFAHVALSPDGSMLAVQAPPRAGNDPLGQIGVISRGDALAGDFQRVHWLGLGEGPVWSPDGRKLLFQSAGTQAVPSPVPSHLTHAVRKFAVVQVGSWQRTDVPVDLDLRIYWGVSIGWSKDSNQLVYPSVSPQSTAVHVIFGPMQYVNLDGTLGRRAGADSDSVGPDAYSPSRQRVIIGNLNRPRVVDSTDWHTIMAAKDAKTQFVGWYDESHVIALRWPDVAGDHAQLQVLDLSGHVTRQVEMPGNTMLFAQFRSSVGLTGNAAQLGF